MHISLKLMHWFATAEDHGIANLFWLEITHAH